MNEKPEALAERLAAGRLAMVEQLTDEVDTLRRENERLRELVRHILGDRITPEAYLLFGKAWVDEAHAALRREPGDG